MKLKNMQSKHILILIFCFIRLQLATVSAIDWPQKAWQITVASSQSAGCAQAAGIVRDSSGACYVSGWGTIYPAGNALILQKYSADGNLLWTKQHPAPQGDFLPRGLAINSTQQIILCAYTTVPKPMLVLFWYDSDGTLLHEARYQSPQDYEIYNAIMAVAPSGQVYLTAITPIGSVIIKYSTTGEQLWLHTEEVMDLASGAFSIAAVDAEDCLLVGGSHHTEQASIFLWKLDAAGNFLWRSEFNEPGWHFPVDIRIDRQGFSYLLAMSQQPEAYTYDLLMLSFTPDGTLDWTEYYETGVDGKASPGQLAIDDSANLYIAGIRANQTEHTEIFIISHDHLGNRRWQTTYDAGGYAIDQVRDLAVTGNGMLSLTAISNYYYSYKIVINLRLNALGELQWVSRYPDMSDLVNEAVPEAIATGDDGRLIVVGRHCDLLTGIEQLLVMSLDAQGTLAWQQRTPGEQTSKDLFTDFVVDVSSRVHVLGTGAGTDLPFLGVWSSNGALLWRLNLDDARFYSFHPEHLSVDRGGASFLSGTGQDAERRGIFVVVRVNPEGQLLWIMPIRIPDQLQCVSVAQMLDQQGNLIVSGGVYKSTPNTDILTFKVNAQGEMLWQATYDGLESSDNYPRVLNVDAVGNVYVAAVGFKEGRVLLKYDASGRMLWRTNYRHSSTSYDEPRRIEIDDQENAYLLGYCQDMTQGVRQVGVLSKFDRRGRLLWQQTIGESDAFVRPDFIAITNNHGVIVAGYYWNGVSSSYDFVNCYGVDGQEIWQKMYAQSLTHDYGLSRQGDLFILKESRQGERMIVGFDGDGASLGEWHLAGIKPSRMQIDWNDHFYFAGNRIGYDWSIFDLAKYASQDTVVVPEQMRLEQNYPNPFLWTTTIRYALPAASYARIVIYDQLGRQVEELIDAPHLAGWHEVRWSGGHYASGIYFVRLSAGNRTLVKKLALVK